MRSWTTKSLLHHDCLPNLLLYFLGDGHKKNWRPININVILFSSHQLKNVKISVNLHNKGVCNVTITLQILKKKTPPFRVSQNLYSNYCLRREFIFDKAINFIDSISRQLKSQQSKFRAYLTASKIISERKCAR